MEYLFLTVYGTAALAIALGLGYRYFAAERRRFRRWLRQHRQSTLADLSPGAVRLAGMLDGERALVSPISQTPCLGWQLRVYKPVDNPYGPVAYERLPPRTQLAPCVITDGARKVEVDPSYLQLLVQPIFFTEHPLAEAPSAVQRMIPDSALVEPLGEVKWAETLLLPGQEFLFYGWCLQKLGAGQGYRDTEQVLYLAGRPGKPALLLDATVLDIEGEAMQWLGES